MEKQVNLNLNPLGSYDILVGMDWLEGHKVILNCLDKTFTCVDDKWNCNMIIGVPKNILVRNIFAIQLKKIGRKGCKLFVVHVLSALDEPNRSLENLSILRDYRDVLPE